MPPLTDSQSPIRSVDAIIALFLRLGIGLVLFFAGLNKFLREGGASGVSRAIIDRMSETLLPTFLVTPYAYALPYTEVAIGILLFVGLYTRQTLVVSGMLFLSLALGLLAQKDGDTIVKVINYLFITCFALWFSERDNRYSTDHLRRR